MFFSPLEDNYKLIGFHSAFTCIYFPIVVGALYFTNNLYIIGKYSFFPVIGIILFAEYCKYLIGTYRLGKKITSSGRFDERYVIGSTKKGGSKSKFRELMKCCVTMIVTVAVFFILAVLFGAEVFSKHEETLMLSILLWCMTVFPVCLNCGTNTVTNLFFSQKPPNDISAALLRNIHLTLLGAWLGAFVIPLDWDRAWQEWPIPCSTGAMLGFIGANVFTLVTMIPKFAKKYSGKYYRKQH